MGQTPHQPRPKNGTATRIRMAYQAIQTKTMLKLWLPTGVPTNPATIANKNPANMSTKATS